MGPEAARGTAALGIVVLALVGASGGRVLFGFLDAATLRHGTLGGALDEALSTALRAPGRVVAAAAGLAVYRVVVPVVAYGFVAANVPTNQFLERPFLSPELAVPPADAPAYVSAPDPSLAPELLAGLVLVDVLVTMAVWPVALGYHFTLFETLQSSAGEATSEHAPAGAPEAQ